MHEVTNEIDPKPMPVQSKEDSRPVEPEPMHRGGAPGLKSTQGGGANQPVQLARLSGR